MVWLMLVMQPMGAEGHDAHDVGSDHQPSAVPAVDGDSGRKREQCVRHEPRKAGDVEVGQAVQEQAPHGRRGGQSGDSDKKDTRWIFRRKNGTAAPAQ